jgi:hypothetical protein
MKMHQALFNPAVLSLLVAIAGGSVLWGGTPAHAVEPWNTALVSIAGTVSGAPESVSFSGQAQVASRRALDPDFNNPGLVFSIDLTGVTGVGLSTKKKYVIQGPEIVQRKLVFSHQVEITFPFVDGTSTGMSSTRSGLAAFTLSVDVNTGVVTTATASVATPSF